MKLNGRRESTNVDDRRGISGKTAGGLGIGGIIIAALIAWATGGDPLTAVMQSAQEQMSAGTQTEQREFTAEEQELATFSKQILAGTEDVWTKVFKEQLNSNYPAPTMVLYTGSVQTGCGNGSAQMGPFYCSADQCLYLDLSFFTQMKRGEVGSGGDFAYAYVIAHEVGHHVEYLTGLLDKCHQQMARMNEKDANKVSVRIELLADFYAGVWGYYDNKMFASLEDGDLEEAIKCAEKIGDNYLQEQAQGYSVPESFTHGTSAQRMKWLKLGLQTGNMSLAEQILTLPENQL
ncbi:MAG: neutral zinc metallopeptidase [Bacteroidales bacterium]|nr:neutral zinc metallopeptidase [Candidatus Equimonas faecalis]